MPAHHIRSGELQLCRRSAPQQQIMTQKVCSTMAHRLLLRTLLSEGNGHGVGHIACCPGAFKGVTTTKTPSMARVAHGTRLSACPAAGRRSPGTEAGRRRWCAAAPRAAAACTAASRHGSPAKRLSAEHSALQIFDAKTQSKQEETLSLSHMREFFQLVRSYSVFIACYLTSHDKQSLARRVPCARRVQRRRRRG